MVTAVANALREREPGWIVEIAHLEISQPDVPAGIEACIAAGATQLVVHPYFIAPGVHTVRDLEALLSAARERHPTVSMRITGPLGFDERIVDVVLNRIREGE